MPAPTFVAEYESAWNVGTSPRTTSVTTTIGDKLVLVAIAADSSVTLGVPTGGTGLTWTAQESLGPANSCRAYAYTATATTAETFSASVTKASGGTNTPFGFIVLRFSGSDGFGAAESATGSGAPSRTITTTQADSALVVGVGDWNATDGTSRTWRTVNGSAATEQAYFRDSAQYTLYVGRHADAGAIGSKTVGLTAPTGQAYTIVAVEVLGTTGASTPSQGTGSGSFSFSGSGSGRRTPKASGSGSFAFAGSGSGSAPRRGSGGGTVSYSGSGSGRTVRRGTGSGTLAWAGSGSGSAPAVEGAGGSGSGVVAYVGSGSGKRTPKASGTGAVAFAGSGSGSAPAVDQRDGAGAGSWAFAGSGVGKRQPVASGSGAIAYAGTGTGTTTRSGSGSGALAFAGSGIGLDPANVRDSARILAARVRAPAAHGTVRAPEARGTLRTPTAQGRLR